MRPRDSVPKVLRVGVLTLLVLAAVACSGANERDGVTAITYKDHVYTGAVIPGLVIDDTAVSDMGPPEQSNLGREVGLLELAGVDPSFVVVVRGQPSDVTDWILFVRDGLIGDGRNLFEAVPAMRLYAPTQPECSAA